MLSSIGFINQFRNLTKLLIINLILLACSSDPPATVTGTNNQLVEPPLDFKSWEVEELSDSLSKLNDTHFVFMEEASMIGTYLELISAGDDDRLGNDIDEIYYIHEGIGEMAINGSMQTITPGMIIYSKKGMNPRFNEIDEKLQVVIVGIAGASNTSNWTSFLKEEMEVSRNSTSNVWNPFVQLSRVTLGLYMLPRSIGGDSRLTHSWQELNIVTSGSSSFKMDTEEISVKRGSIVFVDEGNGHFFRSLTDDIDILIFWEQP